MLTKRKPHVFRARPVLGGMVALCLFTTAPVRAARAETAADLIQEGVALRRKGSDEAALSRFQRAYELDKSARAQGQMGLAEQALGRWVQAHADLTAALAAASDPWVAKNAAGLREALAEVSDHVGKLEIVGGSPGAEVKVDGVSRGKLPLDGPLMLPLGLVNVQLSGPGLVSVQRSAQIKARQTARESFDPLAVAAAPAAEPPVSPSTTPSPAQAPPAPVPDHGPSTARASAKWIAWGGAVVALGVGVFGYARQSGAASDFNDNCVINGAGVVSPAAGTMVSASQCQTWRDRRDTGFAIEVVGLVGFVAAAATGTVLWLTEPVGETQTAWRACAPGVGPGGRVEVGCSWRF